MSVLAAAPGPLAAAAAAAAAVATVAQITVRFARRLILQGAAESCWDIFVDIMQQFLLISPQRWKQQGFYNF